MVQRAAGGRARRAPSPTGADACTHVIGADTVGDKQRQDNGADEDLRERGGGAALSWPHGAAAPCACMHACGWGGGECGTRRRRLASPLNQRALLLTHVNSLQVGQGVGMGQQQEC